MRTLFFAVSVAAAFACSSAPSAPATAPAAAGEAKPAAPAAAKPGPDGKVQVVATKEGFEPNRIEAKAGQPLTLVFTRTEEKTCMTGVVFPELGIEKDIPIGTPVEVTVTPKADGKIAFQCPMGMGKSTIVGVP